MAVWNQRNLLAQPVLCELKVNLTEEVKDEINNAYNQTNQCVMITKEHLSAMATEAYILKRLLYKWCNQFRSKKSQQGLKQMNTCLKRLETVQLIDLIETLSNIVRIPLGESTAYLPSRERLQYYLIRLRGIAALLTQLALYCQNNYMVVKRNLQVGDMIPHYVIMLALSARIWYISRSLCNYLCQWYEAFWPYLTILEATNVPWLPAIEKELPSDLKAWLLEVFPHSALAESEERDITDAAHEEVTDQVVPSLGEDLGEPIQRSAVMSTRERMHDDTDSTEGEERLKPADGNNNQHLLKKKQQQLQKKTQPLPDLRKYLKSHINSDEDVAEFEKTLLTLQFVLNGCQFKLTKLQSRKLIKKIHMLWSKIKASFSEREKAKVLHKKMCRIVAKQLSDVISGEKNVSEHCKWTNDSSLGSKDKDLKASTQDEKRVKKMQKSAKVGLKVTKKSKKETSGEKTKAKKNKKKKNSVIDNVATYKKAKVESKLVLENSLLTKVNKHKVKKIHKNPREKRSKSVVK